MPTPSPFPLDVRPLCDRGQPPLPAILNTVSRLEPGQCLELTVAFEPVPLYDFLRARGFSHEVRQAGPDVWVILFTPTDC